MSFYSYSTGVDLAKLYAYLHGLGKIIPKKTGLKIMVRIPSTHSFQIQALDALKEVHEAGFLHQDVKPVRKSFKQQANFVLSQDQNKVYLVDFGLAVRFQDAEGVHRVNSGLKNSFRGTISYASLNAHDFKVSYKINPLRSYRGETTCGASSTCSWS